MVFVILDGFKIYEVKKSWNNVKIEDKRKLQSNCHKNIVMLKTRDDRHYFIL